MIIEGLLSTTNEDGTVHLAAMGPVVGESLERWTLRPFQTSSTFRNLRRQSTCVFHVVDDVLLLVRVVLGRRLERPLVIDRDLAWKQEGADFVLAEACQWYQLRVTEWNVESQRSEAQAVVLNQGTQRAFWGWNRAKHAVIELTVLMTRLHMLEASYIESEIERLKSPVEKTAGPKEFEAWQLLMEFWQAHKSDVVEQP